MAKGASRVVAMFVAATVVALKTTVSAATGNAAELVSPPLSVEKFDNGPTPSVLHEPVP